MLLIKDTALTLNHICVPQRKKILAMEPLVSAWINLDWERRVKEWMGSMTTIAGAPKLKRNQLERLVKQMKYDLVLSLLVFTTFKNSDAEHLDN